MKNSIKDLKKEIQIIKNAKIIYKNGKCENFQIVLLTKKGVFICHFKKGKSFVEEGFIPRFNIQEIEGEKIKKVYKRIF